MRTFLTAVLAVFPSLIVGFARLEANDFNVIKDNEVDRAFLLESNQVGEDSVIQGTRGCLYGVGAQPSGVLLL